MADTRFDPKQWDLWGNWNNCVLYGSTFLNWPNSTLFKELDLASKGVKGYMKHVKGYFFVLKQDLKRMRELAVESIESDGKYLKQMFKICDRKTKELLELENSKDLARFFRNLVDFAGFTDIIELTAGILDSYFAEVCEKQRGSFIEFMEIAKPSRDTELLKYFKRLKEVEEEELDSFVKEFGWVGTHGLEGEGLTKEKALKEKKKLEQQKQEPEKKIPKKYDSIYWVASELIYMRSNLIETGNRVAYGYWDQLEELGKKHGLDYDHVLALTWYELLDLIEKGVLPEGAAQREKKNFGLVQMDGKYDLLFGKELEKEVDLHEIKIDKNLKELKGTVGFKGKAKGRVVVLRDYRDVPRVKEGDIILASETTVDFVPAMAKAAAFVTNQGGLTSHAAIIAREMKKPCIIGTKIATEVFKDDDVVEVDAHKGVVKLIERK